MANRNATMNDVGRAIGKMTNDIKRAKLDIYNEMLTTHKNAFKKVIKKVKQLRKELKIKSKKK